MARQQKTPRYVATPLCQFRGAATSPETRHLSTRQRSRSVAVSLAVVLPAHVMVSVTTSTCPLKEDQ